MAVTTYKVLGQVAPSATTATTLFTVGASKQFVVSTITVCNRSTSATATFRIALRENGDTLANKHYIVYDALILASETISFTLGLTCDASDILEVYASTANLSFNAFGAEVA
jgi:hypothetical protein